MTCARPSDRFAARARGRDDCESEARVASSPNAYDDIVEELNAGDDDDIILSTLPNHVSHWLHIDLPSRIAQLGYPLTTVMPTYDRPLQRTPALA